MLRHKDLHVILLGVKGESRKGLSKKLWKQYENQTHVTILAMDWLFFIMHHKKGSQLLSLPSWRKHQLNSSEMHSQKTAGSEILN